MDKSSQKNLQMLILLVVWRADGVREDGGYWEASIPKIIDFFYNENLANNAYYPPWYK